MKQSEFHRDWSSRFHSVNCVARCLFTKRHNPTSVLSVVFCLSLSKRIVVQLSISMSVFSSANQVSVKRKTLVVLLPLSNWDKAESSSSLLGRVRTLDNVSYNNNDWNLKCAYPVAQSVEQT